MVLRLCGAMVGVQSELEQLDGELARLGRGAGAIRLQLGQTLELLSRLGGHHELGFSSLRAYATERCERGARWASDSRALARKLGDLSELRAALSRGALSWSMVELVAAHATPDTEGALVDQASRSTIRAMRRRLRAGDGPSDEEERTCLAITVDRGDAWAFDHARVLMRAVCGSRSNDALVEALLAEGLTALQTLDAEATRSDPERGVDAAAWRMQMAAWRERAERACEGVVERHVEPADLPAAPVEAATPRELDARIRRLAAELARRDLALGTLFERFRRAGGWRRLGWASEAQYARERVGVSHASLKARLTLARRCERVPAVSEALEAGRVGFEAASLVSRVATPKTMDAWLARAGQRTIKHLRDEVEGVEMLARATGQGGKLLEPPDDETVDLLAQLERYILSGGPLREGGREPANDDAAHCGSQTSRDEHTAATRNETPQAEESQMSGASSPERLRPGAGKVTLRLEMSAALADQWRDLEHRFQRSRLSGSFLAFLSLAAFHSWAHVFDTSEAYAHIYRREGFRCSSPVCSSRKLTPHHLQFRSQGGSDDDENVTGLCLWCHLEGVHGGRLRAAPPASAIRWTIGRDPILIVDGRRRIQIARAQPA